MTEKTLYERLGGAFAIAAVIDTFSDNVLNNPKVGKGSHNPALREWSTKEASARLAGLKFMRTLWVCSVAGGPFAYSGRPLGDAHADLHIAPEEFDEVAAELARALDEYHVPAREKAEVLAAFSKQKPDVTASAHTHRAPAEPHR